jgi:hypothetical protein
MSKIMSLTVLDIVDVERSGSEHNHSKLYDKYIVEISALDADRAQINGYFIARKTNIGLMDRPREQITVHVKRGEDFTCTKDNKIKIKPYVVKLYTTEAYGKSVLRKKYQSALLVTEDN